MYQFTAAQKISTAKLALFFQKFKKAVGPVMVNGTKVTLKKIFIDNLFTLQSDKKLKNDESTLF